MTSKDNLPGSRGSATGTDDSPVSKRGVRVLSIERITVGPPASSRNDGIAREMREEAPAAMDARSARGKPASCMAETLAPFLAPWQGLSPAGATYDQTSGAVTRLHLQRALRALGFDAVNVCVVKMKAYKDLYHDLPLSIRDDARTGLMSGLDAGIAETLSQRLEKLTDLIPNRKVIETMPERKDFERVSAKVDESAGGMLPLSVLDVIPGLLLFAVHAKVRGDRQFQANVQPFMDMLARGHLPVGITRDRVFLIVTL